LHRAAPRRILPRVAATWRTLDRVLSRMGACSRGQARVAIAAGRVQVDGRTVRDPDAWVDPARMRVTLDGAPVRARAKEVWALHKPVAYVTTAADEHGRDTVYALLPQGHAWLAPVGRLDRDSSGLLLLTNDSDLAHAITSPATKLPKTYVVRCRGAIGDDALAAFRSGLVLTDGPTAPAVAERVAVAGDGNGGGHGARTTTLRIVLTEGRNRQVRRMVQAIGSRVLTLHRTAIGPIELGELPSGASRALAPDEVRALRAAAADGTGAPPRA
jgi:23S rRNA pseudouridine2605 synthase